MTLLLRFSLGFLLVFTALFLIALVLIQRGRGGGLAGAFGGAGGQSAFGTKAGDVFTRVTVIVASFWILLCILAINVLGTTTSRISPALGGAAGQRVASELDGPAADAPAPDALAPDAPAADAPAGDAPAGDAAKAAPEDAKPAAKAAPESAEPAAEAAGKEAPPAAEPAAE
jgi:preprotein translocase subunit SecG